MLRATDEEKGGFMIINLYIHLFLFMLQDGFKDYIGIEEECPYLFAFPYIKGRGGCLQ